VSSRRRHRQNSFPVLLDTSASGAKEIYVGEYHESTFAQGCDTLGNPRTHAGGEGEIVVTETKCMVLILSSLGSRNCLCVQERRGELGREGGCGGDSARQLPSQRGIPGISPAFPNP